jgi:hypothetical protein
MIALGEFAIPTVSYSFGVVNWTEAEIKDLDIDEKIFEHLQDV